MRTALAAPGACRRVHSYGRWAIGIDRDARPDEVNHGGIEHQSNHRESDRPQNRCPEHDLERKKKYERYQEESLDAADGNASNGPGGAQKQRERRAQQGWMRGTGETRRKPHGCGKHDDEADLHDESGQTVNAEIHARSLVLRSMASTRPKIYQIPRQPADGVAPPSTC